MTKQSVKTKLAKAVSGILVALIAICMVLTALPMLSTSVLLSAKADTVALSGSNLATINSALASYSAGTVVNLTLSDNIDFSVGRDDSPLSGVNEYDRDITGIVVPAGITVNLFMNGKSLTFNKASKADGSHWQVGRVAAIVNYGTLNVYSGATTGQTGTSSSTISIYNSYTNMEVANAREVSFAALEGIHNEGTLAVYRNVNINIESHLTYGDGGDAEGVSIVNSTATGIYNTTNAASCVLNASKIVAKSEAYSVNGNWYGTRKAGGARSFAYGVYGGNITVNGNTEITVNADCGGTEDPNATDFGHARFLTVSYALCSDANINVYGGTLKYSASVSEARDALKSGTSRVYMGGIFYKAGGSVPQLADGNISISDPSKSVYSFTNGTKLLFEAPIASSSTIPVSGYNLVHTASYNTWVSDEGDSNVYAYNYYPTGAFSAGQYTDESGNVYTTTSSTTDGTHPTSIVRGAAEGTYRVHVIYRYWLTASKNGVDTSIVGNSGNVGYSFRPLSDSTDVVDSTVVLSGLTSSNSLVKTGSSAIKYVSGAESCNSNYWVLYNLTYSTSSEWFSNYQFASSSNRGDIFRNFQSSGYTDTECGAGLSTPMYVFVDYYKKDATAVSASIDTGRRITYTGSAIKASDIGLQIKDSVYATDFTSEYNIDFDDPSKISVNFAYTGTNAAGVSVSSTSGQLPRDAGNYSVTLTIPENTAYGKDETQYKNRYALEYTFALTIEQATPLRGTLPTAVSLTYGQRLADSLSFNSYAATGINSEGTVPGIFTFTNVTDGSSFKPAGTGAVSVTWQPSYADSAQVKNYRACEFIIDYNVAKAALTVRPNVASVIYGNSEFSVPFSVTYTGLCANDNNDSTRQTLSDALGYMILLGSSYVTYSPDDIGAGSYPIRATFTVTPAVLANYEVTYIYGITDNPDGVLNVAKRSLTVTATAVGREYAPDNYDVNVTYEVTAGRYGQDDVRVSSSVGALSNNNAGTRQVSGITTQHVRSHITGGAADNYNITEVLYASGSNLTVEITKATPTATVPTVSEMFYQRSRTLADITLAGFTSSVAGEWQWVDRTVNPTVSVSAYAAKFVPADSANYEEKTADVTILVKATPVVVTYNGTVSYGDNVPNITAYTYTAVQDPSFSIDAVETTGNITPYTTYVKGSPVVAGGYDVEIIAPNYRDINGNYTFTTAHGVITVVPRNIVFTVANVAVTYGASFSTSASVREISFDESRLVGDDTAAAITSNGSVPTFTFSSDFNNASNYGVGTYYINATPDFVCSANYTVSVVSGVLTVNKAPLTIKANDITLEYNSNIPDLTSAYTVVGAKRNETIDEIVTGGAISVDTTYYRGAAVTAEGYPVTVDVTGAVFANYTVTAEAGKITVIKATPSVTTLPTATITYGENLGNAVFAGGVIQNGVTGTFTYDSAATVPAYSSTPYTIYTATFIPADTANYNTVTGMYISLTVNRKPISGSLAVIGSPMNGEMLTVDVSGLNPAEIGVYSFTWVMNGTVVGTGTSLTLSDAHVNNTITVTATANNYYTGSATYVTTPIAPVLTSVSVILTEEDYAKYFSIDGLDNFGGATTAVYNAQPHAVTFAQLSSTFSSVVLGDITVKYNGNTAIPTAAGTYIVTIDVGTPANLTSMNIIDNGGVSYDSISGKFVYSPISNFTIGTLTIEKAAYNVTVTVADKIYDGYNTATAEKVVQTGACILSGGIYDDVKFDEAAVSYYFTDANAGAGKTVTASNAALTGSAASNYQLNLTLANGATAAIEKRELCVAVVPVERQYADGNYDVELNFSIDASTVAPADTTANVYINEASAVGTIDDCKAGLRSVTVSGVQLAGSKSANYTLKLTNLSGLTVRIQKATPSYPLPQTGIVYYESGRTLSNISLGDSRWAWASAVANEIPGAGEHEYTAVYTPDDTDNYAEVYFTVPLEIRKTTVTVRAASFTVTYGDGEPTYYYDVTGLTGSDTIRNAVDGYVLMTCSYASGSNIGNYPVVLTGAFESPNYTFTYVNGNVNVQARKAYVTAIAESREYSQGNTSVNVSFSALTNLYEGDGTNVYLDGIFPITGTIDGDTAGTHTVTYASPVLAGPKAANYVLAFTNPNLVVTIQKAQIAGVVLPTSATVAYSQKLSTAVFTSNYAGTQYGTFQMENANSTPTAVGTFTNTYKVTFTPFNVTNYATVSEYITLTVTSYDLNLQLSFAGTPQSGKTLTVVTNSIPSDAAGYIIYEWYRMNNPDDSIESGYRVASEVTSYTLSDADAGKYIICVATQADGSPYNFNTRVATETAAEGVTLTFWQRLIRWFYNIIASLTQIFGAIGG